MVLKAENLNITTIQVDLVWENKPANLHKFESFFESIHEATDIIVLPEMFSTGFSMNVEDLAETINGETITWMHHWAKKKNAVITGSIIVEENSQYYNRLFWIQPDGQQFEYNKRHLFSLSKEPQFFSAGNERLIIEYKGWKILPLICYDLRFPVWCRNDKNNPFDVIILVANWPEKRSFAWKTLLLARAIENQCYVVGVNRVGHDGNNMYHSGNSAVINPLGEYLFNAEHHVVVETVILNKEFLKEIRTKLPFLSDMDDYTIH